MDIVWDPAKAQRNVEKHGIAFSDAEPVLFDPCAITIEDEREDEEQRFITLGMDALGRMLVVIYTYRGQSIRLISVRTATRSERRAYETGI